MPNLTKKHALYHIPAMKGNLSKWKVARLIFTCVGAIRTYSQSYWLFYSNDFMIDV